MKMKRFICLLVAAVLHIDAFCADLTEPSRFFAKPEMTVAKLNPDGRYLGAVVSAGEGQRLISVDLDSGLRQTLLDLSSSSKGDASLGAFSWIDSTHIAIQISEVKPGIRDLWDTRQSNRLLIVSVPSAANNDPEVLSVRTAGWLVDPLPREEGVFLYAKSGIYSRIYKLRIGELAPEGSRRSKLAKIDGGQFVQENETISVEGFVTRWFVDSSGEAVAAFTYQGGKLTFNSTLNGEVKALKSWTKEELNGEDTEVSERLLPISISEEEDTFYCLDLSEEEQRSVYKVNFEKGTRDLVYESPYFAITALITSTADNRLVGVNVLRSGEIWTIYLDGTAERPAARAGRLSVRLDESSNGTVLYYSESHNQPGRYFVLRKDGSKEFVGSTFPHLDGQLKSRLEQGQVSVEGLEIPYLLTLPDNEAKDQYPLVVLPHGGPTGVFDHPYFDLVTQFLAENDYAVLRVNFRGSGGYTPELKKAGKRQWGNLMLADIQQAALQVMSREDIDSDRACVMGMSYGGYAATMVAMNYPNTYRCAINISGVSDINLSLNSSDLTESEDAWLKDNVGNSVDDYDALKSISPVYQVEKLRRPILIIHGAEDNVVDVEHAFRLKLMLEKHGKPFTWHLIPEGKHSMFSPAELIEVFTPVMKFLKRHLG